MKKSEFKAYIREEIIEILSEETAKDIQDKTKAQAELNKELEKTKELTTEEDEAEPTDAELKKSDSVSKIANKMAETTKEMKVVVKKWKEAEEPEKSRLLDRLKELTKIKKELEGLL